MLCNKATANIKLIEGSQNSNNIIYSTTKETHQSLFRTIMVI